MDNCYLCGNVFDTDKVKRHDEHIIQQAIGGVISDKNILCFSCGEYLGREVDVSFNEIFHSISTRLDIKKDRKLNKKSAIKGILQSKIDQFGVDLGEIEVLWKDFKVTPVVPMHHYVNDNSKVIIYAMKKQAKTYAKKVERESKFKDNKPEMVFCDDIEGLVSYPFKLDGGAFKKGLAKIAIGFASYLGIKREDVPLVLDIKTDNSAEIRRNIQLIQYFPLGALDPRLEELKPEVGYFPTHTLIIFTSLSNPSLLVCYIELFSTFQWYVILNDKYQGDPIYEYFYQRLLKSDDYNFEPGRKYYKERQGILSYLGISDNRINDAYEKQKNNNDAKSIEYVEIEIVKEEHIKKKYRVDFEQEIDNSLSVFTTEVIKKGFSSIENACDIKKGVDLFYDYNTDREQFKILNYKRCYVSNGEYQDYIYSLMTLSGSDKLRNYSFSKFNQLTAFTEMEGIKRKLEA
ncbi:HNH endonuclease [Photobacterium iliopiscarium]|uniref:HNH endonuclease 5 domain-containing protein n=1 Tax=Photobacterium iliopiscarium TaxID=56192 RepID=A0A2T3MMN5_9GAMM|nr:HNH endonuclease [Photobacterium iliopiscarium]PSV97858.1 hypothetical protein C9I88_07250 [Photobacterium iliopiscarium]